MKGATAVAAHCNSETIDTLNISNAASSCQQPCNRSLLPNCGSPQKITLYHSTMWSNPVWPPCCYLVTGVPFHDIRCTSCRRSTSRPRAGTKGAGPVATINLWMVRGREWESVTGGSKCTCLNTGANRLGFVCLPSFPNAVRVWPLVVDTQNKSPWQRNNISTYLGLSL